MGQRGYLEWMLETRHELKQQMKWLGFAIAFNLFIFCFLKPMLDWWYVATALLLAVLTVLLCYVCYQYRDVDDDIKAMEARFNLFM